MFREGHYLEVIKASEYCAATVVVTVQEKIVEIKKRKVSTNKWLCLEDWATLYEILEKALRRSSQKFNTSERKKSTQHLEVAYSFEASEDPNSRTSFPTIRVRVSPVKKKIRKEVERTKEISSSSIDSTSTESPKGLKDISFGRVEPYDPSLLREDSSSTRESPPRIPTDTEVEEYIPYLPEIEGVDSSGVKDVKVEYVPSTKSDLQRMQFSTDSNEYSFEESQNLVSKVSSYKRKFVENVESIKDSSSSSFDSTSMESLKSMKDKSLKNKTLKVEPYDPFLSNDDSPSRERTYPKINTGTKVEEYIPDVPHTKKTDSPDDKDVGLEYVPSTKNVLQRNQLSTDSNEYPLMESKDPRNRVKDSSPKKFRKKIHSAKDYSSSAINSTPTENLKSQKDQALESSCSKVAPYHPILSGENSPLREESLQKTACKVKDVSHTINADSSELKNAEFEYVPSTKNVVQKTQVITDTKEYPPERSEDPEIRVRDSRLKKKLSRKIHSAKNKSSSAIVSTSTESLKCRKSSRSRCPKVEPCHPILPIENNPSRDGSPPRIHKETKVEEYIPNVPSTIKSDPSDAKHLEFEYVPSTKSVLQRTSDSKDYSLKKFDDPSSRVRDSHPKKNLGKKVHRDNRMKDRHSKSRRPKVEPYHPMLPREVSPLKIGSPPRIPDTAVEEYIPDLPSTIKSDPSDTKNPETEYVPSTKSVLQRMQATKDSKECSAKDSEEPKVRDSQLEKKSGRKVHSTEDIRSDTESPKSLTDQSSKCRSPNVEPYDPILPRENSPSKEESPPRVHSDTDVEEYIPDVPNTIKLESSEAKDLEFEYVPSRKSTLQKMQLSADLNAYVPAVVSEDAIVDCALDNLYIPNSVPKEGNIYEIYEPSGSVDSALANEYIPNSKGLKKKIEEYQPDFTSKRMKFDNSYVPSSSELIKELKKSVKRSPGSKKSRKDCEKPSRESTTKKSSPIAVGAIKREI